MTPEKHDLWMAKFAGPLAGCALSYDRLSAAELVHPSGFTLRFSAPEWAAKQQAFHPFGIAEHVIAELTAWLQPDANDAAKNVRAQQIRDALGLTVDDIPNLEQLFHLSW